MLFILISLLAISARFGEGADKGCGSNPADIAFVLDESGSIYGPDFTKQLDFVQSVVDTFDVGRDKTQIGVLAFATKERIIFQLGEHNDETQLKAAVKGIKQQRGNTFTNLALKRTCEEMFSSAHARSGVRHVAIVITDGDSDYPKETAKEAAVCHKKDIEVLAVGVGKSVSRKELEAIASSPENVYMADSYAALDALRITLAWKACPPPTEPPTTTTTPAPTTPEQFMINECKGKRKADIVWSISELSSIGENNLALDFIEEVAQVITISPEEVQVGMAPRLCPEGPELRLKDSSSRQEFVGLVQSRRLYGAKTQQTLEYIRNKGTRKENGGERQDVVQFGALIVDFDSADWESTLAEAEAAKNAGVKLIVIGVGKVDKAKLKQVASSAEDFIHVDSYSELTGVKDKVISRFCEGIKGSHLRSLDGYRRRLILESLFDYLQ